EQWLAHAGARRRRRCLRRPVRRRVDPRRDRPDRASRAAPRRDLARGRHQDARGVRLPPMIVLDADVLGRNRTGEETYVLNLLRQLPAVAPDLRFAAVTRRPELVPEGVEAIELPARSQELRMAWSLPRLLRRLQP